VKSYPELNNYINSKLGDGHICHGEQFNYIKIFQHALSYSENGSTRKLLRNYFHFPLWIQYVFVFIRKVAAKASAVHLNDLVLLAENRSKINSAGESVSFYFHEIIRVINPEKLTVINLGSVFLSCDYRISNLSKGRAIPDSKELMLLTDINRVLAKAQKSGLFTVSELLYLKSCFHVFYDEFRFYYSLFKGKGARKVVFTCHYHKEGLLAALNVLDIESVELQHGLIAVNDIYYVYPDQYKTALSTGLFPDRIGVYGEKWKELLLRGCEFTENRIHVIGEYYEPGKKEFPHLAKENLIVVCSQKNLDGDYLTYLKSLDTKLSNHPGWRATVKLHPLEKHRDRYLQSSFEHIDIEDANVSIKELFAKSRIQISIYSTTFFDALGYEVFNISIQNYGYSMDYASEILSMGVAIPCDFNDDPVELYLKERDTYALPNRNDFYAEAEPGALLEWLCS